MRISDWSSDVCSSDLDPQNIGAVLRNAAAFGASAVVVPEHGSPDATGALAKAAAGALETMPLVRDVTLRPALETLKAGGFWRSEEGRAGKERVSQCTSR